MVKRKKKEMEKVGMKELVAAIAERQGCYKVDARSVTDHLVAVVSDSLSAGKAVHIVGLGTFYPSQVVRGRHREGLRARFRPAAALARRLAESQAAAGASAGAQIFQEMYREGVSANE